VLVLSPSFEGAVGHHGRQLSDVEVTRLEQFLYRCFAALAASNSARQGPFSAFGIIWHWHEIP